MLGRCGNLNCQPTLSIIYYRAMVERFLIEPPIDQVYYYQSPLEIEAAKVRYGVAWQRAVEILKKGKLTWLDIGSNRGLGLSGIKISEGTVVATDIKERYPREALMRNPGVKGTVTDGCALCFSGSVFDAVSVFEVIEHLEEIGQKGMIGEIKRVLKPGGLLFISTPNREASGKRRMGPEHKKEFNFNEFKDFLESNGLRILAVLGQGFFKQTFSHKLFRTLRENPLSVFIFYYLLPWSLRSRITDLNVVSQSGDQVRKPFSGETERIMLAICQKSSQNR